MTARAVALLLAALVGSAPAVQAQTVLHADGFASSGEGSFKNMVRAEDGTLYLLSIEQDGAGVHELRLRFSQDQGLTWQLDTTVLNDASTGMVAVEGTNFCSLAIDPLGQLHVLWASYHLPSNYQQWYRQYDPVSQVAGTVLNVSALTSAPTDKRTWANAIAVGKSDLVWMTAHGPEPQVERLLRSLNPGGFGGIFIDLGNIDAGAFSSRNTRLVIDSNGLVHMTYFRSVGTVQYEHRIYDPGSGWQTAEVVGNKVQPADNFGALVADDLGNVHCIVGMDTTSGSALWQYQYRRWNAASGWGPLVPVFEATQAQHAGISDEKIIALSVDEQTGRATAIYRDLANGGVMRTASKDLTDSNFTENPPFDVGTGAPDEFRWPTVRGVVYPEFNQSGGVLDVTWQRSTGAPTAPWELVHQRLTNGPSIAGGPPGTSLGSGGVQSLALDAGAANAGKTYILLGSSAVFSPGFPIDGVLFPLSIDPYLLHTLANPNGAPLSNSFGALDADGRASAGFTLPAGALAGSWAGLQLHHAFLVFDLAGPTAVFASTTTPVTLTP